MSFAASAALKEDAPRSYSPREIEEMDTETLLDTYKRTGDQALKWPLVLRYEGMIKNVALQIRGVYSSFAQVDDIIDEGILTLLSAIDKYDPEKGVKFETYVTKRIRGMVVDLARKQDWLPRNIRQRSKEIDRAISSLASTLGRFPNDEEVAEYLGVSVERYQKDAASVSMSHILSLDALMDARNTDSYRPEIPDHDSEGQPEAAFQKRELQTMLAQGIQSLRENERIVLSLYYERNLPMKEIAQVLDISRPRVSQIHARALQKLRTYMGAYLNGEEEENGQNEWKEGSRDV
jgi:RNA polymerase sigma factor for flagellar operon FliA